MRKKTKIKNQIEFLKNSRSLKASDKLISNSNFNHKFILEEIYRYSFRVKAHYNQKKIEKDQLNEVAD